MDTLCVDKTGTITANHLAVARVIPIPAFTEEEVLRHAAYASEAANQDPIDLTILAAARDRMTMPRETMVLSFVPFDATRRRTEAVVQSEGRPMRVVKGAVDIVAHVCALDVAARDLLARHQRHYQGGVVQENRRCCLRDSFPLEAAHVFSSDPDRPR